MPQGPQPLAANPWLQLLRPANVVTALADVLAGYGVGASGREAGPDLAWLLGSTACLYAGGVVFNDYFDRHLDGAERPERPIPSGRVAASSAAAVGAGCLAAGLGLAAVAGAAAAAVAGAIATAVLLYDAWGKHRAFLGPVNMGLCRALNFLLGLAATPAVLAARWPLALVSLVYIAAVTMVSRGEVSGGRRPVALAALALVVGVVAVLLALAAGAAQNGGFGPGVTVALALAGLLAWRVLPAFVQGARRPDAPTLRAAVRAGVLSLVLVDAVIAAVYADIIYCLTILLTGVAALRLARLFAVT